MNALKEAPRRVESKGVWENSDAQDTRKQLFRYMMLASLIFGPGAAEAQLMNGAGGASLFADVRAYNKGDLVTILIMEESAASSSAQTSTDKDHQLSAGGSGSGSLSAFPSFGLEGSAQNKFEGAAHTSRQGTLRAKMTAMVVDIRENGNLVIEGSRSVKINNETETTIVRGEVRLRDVSSGNTVYSYDLANVQITHLGKGTVNSGQRPGLLVRLFNLLF